MNNSNASPKPSVETAASDIKKPSRYTISVIVSSYNYKPYVGKTLDSILNQTRKADEIIVVDDGSTDGSPEFLQTYADRVQVILKENGGQASALNVGFSKSHGDIIIFIDSDDLILENCLETLEAAWNDDLSKIQFGLMTIDDKGVAMNERRPGSKLHSGDLTAQILETGCYITTPTSGNAFSRRALEQLMPIPEDKWRTYADCYLLFQTPFLGKVGAIHEILGEYRVHPNNSSGLVRNGVLQISPIRSEIVRDIRQQNLLESFCAKRNLKLRKDAVLRNWYAIKLRLVSKKIDPEKHPIPSETMSSLVGQAVMALLRAPDVKPLNKLVFSGWALAMSLAPKNLAEKLACLAYDRPNNGGYGGYN